MTAETHKDDKETRIEHNKTYKDYKETLIDHREIKTAQNYLWQNDYPITDNTQKAT